MHIFEQYVVLNNLSVSAQDILHCKSNEVTLVFKQKVVQGSHLEMYDLYLELRQMEYQSRNTLYYFDFYLINHENSFVLNESWDEKFEKSRVENGFKWSPIKSYYRKIRNGIQNGDGWKIRINMNQRNEISVPAQEFVLIITIKDSEGADIYSEVINGLRERGYVTNNLETRNQIRQRQ